MDTMNFNAENFESEYGVVKQVCDLEKGNEIIRDRETGKCMNPDKKCSECEHYHETWNHHAYIMGLKWILEDDRFGFGENWKKGSHPAVEEENAGYIICRVIEYLESMKTQ